MSAGNTNAEDAGSTAQKADHRLVVFAVSQDIQALEDGLMALPQMDRATARMQSRLMPGIIPYAYTAEAAELVAAALCQQGMTAEGIPVQNIPDLLHAFQTHHVQLTKTNLEVMDTTDHSQAVPWDKIAVISVGSVPSSSPSRFRGPAALSAGSSHKAWNEGVHIGGRSRPEALIVLSDGQPGFMLASDEMNYEYLGERLSTASTANFRLLLRDIISHAPAAWVTPSTVAFLDHTHDVRTDFKSHDEFRRYTEFQALLSQRYSKPPQS